MNEETLLKLKYHLAAIDTLKIQARILVNKAEDLESKLNKFYDELEAIEFEESEKRYKEFISKAAI